MVFYPDNIPRRDRALQLQNDISNFQQNVAEAKDAMEKEDKRMVPYINTILKNHNMSTFDELKKKLDDSLTDEQKQTYKDLCDNASKLTQGTDTALMAMSGILFTSGVLAKTIDIGNFLRAANIVTVFRSYTRAFITFVTEGAEAGLKAFRMVSTVFKWAGEGLVETSKLARYAANVGKFLKVLAIVGIFADAFILAFDYFEQKEQCEKLEDAINKLYVSRIICKMYARMCDTIKSQDGMMLSYLILVGDDGKIDPDDQRAADKIANKFVSYIQEGWQDITPASSLDLLVVMDSKRGSWTTRDPPYQTALDDANGQLKDSDTKKGLKGAPTTASFISEAYADANASFEPPPTYEVAAGLIHVEDLSKAHLHEHFVANII